MKSTGIYIKYLKKFTIASAVIMTSAGFSSCHKAETGKENESASLLESRPDEGLTLVMKTIADGDAEGFASICVYPVRRPYPLKDITDSIAMTDYFPVMIDDSIRNMMQGASLDDWESYGWRGWSITEGTPVWYDEGVQYVDYTSEAERGLRRLLAREEIESLSPEFRDDWNPVMTLISSDRQKLYRIDSKGDEMRLMGFEAPFRVNGKPSVMMMGKKTSEGSGDYAIYDFHDVDGSKAEYSPDAEPPVKIIFTSPSATENDIEVYPSYWRDEVKY